MLPDFIGKVRPRCEGIWIKRETGSEMLDSQGCLILANELQGLFNKSGYGCSMHQRQCKGNTFMEGPKLEGTESEVVFTLGNEHIALGHLTVERSRWGQLRSPKSG